MPGKKPNRPEDHEKSQGVVICSACFNHKDVKKSCNICHGSGYVRKP